MTEFSEDEMLEKLRSRQRSRSERRVFNKRTTFLSVFALVLFAILAILILRSQPRPETRRASAGQVEHYKRLADQLKIKGLPEQAMRYYEKYLESADLQAPERANVSYLVAELAVTAGRYEQALVWLNSAELWGATDAVQAEVGRLQRLCFERLGRSFDADYQLAASASLDAAPGSPRGAIVAAIGSEKVTMGEIDDAIQALPKFVRDQYSTPAKKPEFIQQYVNTRILCRKAKNLGYDKEPGARKLIEAAASDIVVRAFLKKEVQDKVEVTDSELKLYHQVNQARYAEPGQVRLAHILVGTEKEATDLIAKVKAGADFADLAKQHSKDSDTRTNGGEIPGWLTQRGALPAMPDATGLSQAVFELKPGDFCQSPVKSGRGWHVVKVIQKKDGRAKPLAEVRKQVDAAYRAEKQQEILERMLKDAHKELQVQLFPEAMVEDAAKAQPSPKKLRVPTP